MKPSPPVLTPILRSDTQGLVLANLYLHPDREYSPSELARLARTSLPTVLRELTRMVPMGFLRERSVGRNRLISADQSHPLFQPIQEILVYAYGPVTVLQDVLRGLAGLDQAYIYGSWAARLQGHPGSDPADIDVLLVGDVDRMAALEAADQATVRLGRPVNTHRVSRSAWDRAADVFIKTVRGRPLLRLDLDSSAAGDPE